MATERSTFLTGMGVFAAAFGSRAAVAASHDACDTHLVFDLAADGRRLTVREVDDPNPGGEGAVPTCGSDADALVLGAEAFGPTASFALGRPFGGDGLVHHIHIAGSAVGGGDHRDETLTFFRDEIGTAWQVRFETTLWQQGGGPPERFGPVPFRTFLASGFASGGLQEHTVAPIERTSLPTNLWTKLMPTRHVTTSCVPKGNDWEVTVVVTGASTEGPHEPSGQPTTSRPRMRLKMFHEADTAIGTEEDLVDREGRQNLPRNDVRRQPVLDGDMTVGWTKQHENGCIWTLTAPVSQDTRRRLGPGKYVVYVTEIERYMPATYRDADTGMLIEPVDWATMKRADTLVEAGPLFAMRIELVTPASKLDSGGAPTQDIAKPD